MRTPPPLRTAAAPARGRRTGVALAAPAACAAALLGAPRAHAIRPDFDGERGVEAHLTAGYGSLFNTSERLFQSQAEATGAGQPADVLSGGSHLRLGAGYRPTPLFSVGAVATLQGIGSAPSGTDPASAGAWALGAYGRFYPMALATGMLAVRRVNFDNAGQAVRRLEPWVSLGLELHTLWRSTRRESTGDTAAWTNRALAVPLAAGFDVRLLPMLAAGVSLGVAPTFSLGVGKVETGERVTGPTRTESSYAAAAGVNAAWFLGVGVRYTLTL